MNDTVRAGNKRHTPITFGADSPKHARTSISNQREIYTPPSGKYSNKVSSYSKFSCAAGKMSHIFFPCSKFVFVLFTVPQRGGMRGIRSRGRGFGGRGRGAWRRNY